ncbi:MAG: DUF4247 domain-containing protein [Actinomycetota bacterium]|nr:DUF4247 domain-containing protein [Actinomycetota bacterium]
MTPRAKLLIAGAIALVGVVALVVALTRTGGVRAYLAENYQQVARNGDSVQYRATGSPRTVSDDIRSRHRPADTLVQPTGYYLRYSDDIVVVTANGGGSRIYLDDEDRGYARWFPIIGGFWGTFRGPGEGFRGGGPGSGK